MAFAVSPYPKLQFFDDNGYPLSGGKLYTYAAGTSTPRPTYTSHLGAIPNPNPVVLDAGGRVRVWLDTTLLYKFVLKNSEGVTVFSEDYISAGGLGGGASGGCTFVDDTIANTEWRFEASNGFLYLRRYTNGIVDLEYNWGPN